MQRIMRLLAAASVVLAASLAHGEELTVVTYNVHGLPALLIGDRSDEISNIARQLEDLRRAEGDARGVRTVVSLQEVFAAGYYRSLTDRAAVTFPYLSGKDHGGTFGLGNGLTRLSDLPFTNHRHVAWSECFGRFGLFYSDCDTDKGFAFARHEVAPGAFIDIYELHADAGKDDGSLAARRSNLQQLLAAMRELSPEGTAVIVMGDANARYTRSPQDNLDWFVAAAGLRDVWVELVRAGEVPGPGASMKDACGGDPAGGDCERLDKIFYRSGDTVTLRATRYAVLSGSFTDERGRALSDHLPVLARFDVRVTEASMVAAAAAGITAPIPGRAGGAAETAAEPDRFARSRADDPVVRD